MRSQFDTYAKNTISKKIGYLCTVQIGSYVVWIGHKIRTTFYAGLLQMKYFSQVKERYCSVVWRNGTETRFSVFNHPRLLAKEVPRINTKQKVPCSSFKYYYCDFHHYLYH